jgi:hypothetical protein
MDDDRRKPSRPEVQIPGPPSRAKRDRSWERKQRRKFGQVTYRGVPTEIRDRITEIAGGLHVTTGDVARCFLEFAISAHEAGELELRPVLEHGKFTLYPSEE